MGGVPQPWRLYSLSPQTGGAEPGGEGMEEGPNESRWNNRPTASMNESRLYTRWRGVQLLIVNAYEVLIGWRDEGGTRWQRCNLEPDIDR